MGSSSGFAGLKCLQWTFRVIQFCCSVAVLGIYSYFLATLLNHGMTVTTNVKALEGISAIATLYTALGVLLVCCCAGNPAPSFIAMVLDVGFVAAFIYVAVANRSGASTCTGANLDTVYGTGDAAASPSSSGGGSLPGGIGGLPTFKLACQLEMACLIASCVAVLFFILTIPMEIKLNRSRARANRPIRDADGEYINKSAYAGGGAPPPQRHEMPFFGRFGAFRPSRPNGFVGNPDALPSHQQPGDVQQTRQVAQWGEISSLHGSGDELYFNDGTQRDPHEQDGPPVRFTSTTAPRPAADEYTEGDVGNRDFHLYEEDEKGNDISETGKSRKQRESRDARVERLVEA